MTARNEVRFALHVDRKGAGRIELQAGAAPAALPRARVPRVSRLMALAHRFDRLLREGTMKSMADLARVGHVTRARITQIMNLLLLAPDLQEELLFLPAAESGRDRVPFRAMRAVCATPVWTEQRTRWAGTKARLADRAVHTSRRQPRQPARG
jgi:hypothetical protein